MAVIPQAWRRFGGRWVLILSAFAALVLAPGLPLFVDHDHDHDHGGDRGELPCHCQCTGVTALAVVPDETGIVAPPLVGAATVTDYIAAPHPDVIVGVDPPPDKQA